MTLLIADLLALFGLIAGHASTSEIALALVSDVSKRLAPSQWVAVEEWVMAQASPALHALFGLFRTWPGVDSGVSSTDDARARRERLVALLTESARELVKHAPTSTDEARGIR